MLRTRIQLYTDTEMKRRITLAATKYDVPITQYCFEAVQQRLVEDDLIEQAHIEIPVTQPSLNTQLISNLRALDREIKASHQGKPPLDVEAVLDQIHEEREHDLLGLR